MLTWWTQLYCRVAGETRLSFESNGARSRRLAHFAQELHFWHSEKQRNGIKIRILLSRAISRSPSSGDPRFQRMQVSKYDFDPVCYNYNTFKASHITSKPPIRQSVAQYLGQLAAAAQCLLSHCTSLVIGLARDSVDGLTLLTQASSQHPVG